MALLFLKYRRLPKEFFGSLHRYMNGYVILRKMY